MNVTWRARRRIAAALLAAVAMAGCGSSGKKATTTTAAASAAVTTLTTVKATGGGSFCTKVADAINNGVSKAAQAFQQGRTPDQLKTEFEQTRKAEQDALSGAPSEIKADLQVLISASNKVFDALSAANYDFTKVDPAALSSVNTPAVQTASQHVTAYVKDHCGIDVGGTAPTASSTP